MRRTGIWLAAALAKLPIDARLTPKPELSTGKADVYLDDPERYYYRRVYLLTVETGHFTVPEQTEKVERWIEARVGRWTGGRAPCGA
jgi:hypothetical protein